MQKILQYSLDPHKEVSAHYLGGIVLLWTIATLIGFIYLVYRAGSFRDFLKRFAPSSNYIPLAKDPVDDERKTSFKQRTFHYPDTLVSNYIDPDDIPDYLKPYSEAIFLSAPNIMKRHGFQSDNTRNQAEHLAMLLFNETRASDKVVSVPALRIHRRLFFNYQKWCDKVGVRPLLLKDLSPIKTLDILIEDMLIFLLIWGEAANLRHLPECLCFLFHKVMEEHLQGRFTSNNGRSGANAANFPERYCGYFLDMVVTPIYEEIAKSFGEKVDHSERKIYDDFNEFFWSPSCLSYSLHPELHEDHIEVGNNRERYKPLRDLPAAIRASSKTYLEKRSWFHPLYAMNRVFEWHVITFTMLATLSFANLLQWTNNYMFQVGSFVFWEITFLGILWTFLELWTLFPSVHVSDAALCGFLIRILVGFLILCYQTVYFHWSFVLEADSHLKDIPLFNRGDNQFWWWQYVWLSLISLTFYFIQSILSVFPAVGSSVLSWKSDLVQAFLSICYPLSQLYVGKRTNVPQSEVFNYIFFWATLITFKIWFGYEFVVSPVATPTLELYDDFMNYPTMSFYKTSLLIFFWWLPHFLVYIIDLYIWYSVWASMAGGVIAILDRLGAVRDSDTFRKHFMRAPKFFHSKLMPSIHNEAEEERSLPSHLSTMSLTDVVPEPTIKHNRSKSYQSGNASSEFERNAELRNQEWLIFARVWNEIVARLRERDYLSNRERDLLLFTNFDWLSKPTYLPLYQTAGCVETASSIYIEYADRYEKESDKQLKIKIVEDYYSTVGTQAFEALFEAWELLSWMILELLGGVHHDDAKKITEQLEKWAMTQNIFGKLASENVRQIVESASQVAKELKSVAEKRKKPVVPADYAGANEVVEPTPRVGSDGKTIKKSLSTGFLPALSAEMEGSNKFQNLQPFRQKKELVDRSRDVLREALKSLFGSLKSAMKHCVTFLPEAQTLNSNLSFILTSPVGFFVSDAYASRCIDKFSQDRRLKPAASKLHNLLVLRVTEVELASREANRRLNFLLNSLYMDIPKIPATRYCKEYTCVTPYYSEDILLTKADLTEENSDRVTVLLYLQTLYKHDWANFLERKGIDESAIWSPEHLADLRIWASCRAQTLFRTVDGMMYTEAAIRLLAELEQLSAPEVDWLCKMKFNYVVACQVYGVFKKNNDSKADDIEFLLARFPNLRVAYIDVYRPHANEASYYSVLIKALGAETSGKPKIKEVFRIKLPGNPVLGEGKPENQNHAIVFTRGRYLQAIDMNQDGYFEEALKMRNLLEEFNNNHAIVGFREHIFTGSVSSVANYMALQELSFVTLGQRVLNRPLRIRQHYGHPDLFDKLFVMTEGGMSKASRGINLSEDVFAGFNATIRGHSVAFVEYAQVGKGRDVGLQQTYKFEAKLSQGNAEQSISRDLSRIGNRLDFFRLLSFYYGGIGHYLSNSLVMFTLVIIVYTLLALAIYGEEGVNGRALHPEGVFQMVLAGMGILQTLPLAVTLTVEKGFRAMVSEISFMILSGGPLYFIFHIQTKSHYFSQTLLAGGAKYRPTGRGFVTRHSPFEENYRFFASSHIYMGFELMVALVLFAFYTTSKQYPGLTWSLWLSALALVFGPFWFNPLSFEWNRIADDYSSWLKWMLETGGSTNQSWEAWWKDENSFYHKLSATWKFYLILQKSIVWFLIAGGIAGKKFFMKADEQLKLLEVVGVVSAFFFLKYILHRFEKDWTYPVRRFSSLFLSTTVGITLIVMFVTHTEYFLYTIALYYFLAGFSFLFLVTTGYSNHYILNLYKTHDYIVGYFIFFCLSIACFFQVRVFRLVLCTV